MELQEKISNYLSTLNEASCGCDSNCSCKGNCGSDCNCKSNCKPVNESIYKEKVQENYLKYFLGNPRAYKKFSDVDKGMTEEEFNKKYPSSKGEYAEIKKTIADMNESKQTNEDKTDAMKRDKLNDIFQALERLNGEFDELATMDMNYDSTGAGDLTDQLTTMRKHIEALYQVLDRSSAIVPMEADEGEVEEADEIIQSIPSKTVKLAGDSIWDRDGSNPESVQVSNVTIENPYEPGGYMDDDEDDGYRKISVEHDGPWTIYTDSGFEAAISKMVGFKVVFTEQGMQEDGMASMEGGSEGFDEAKNTPVSNNINRLRQLAGV